MNENITSEKTDRFHDNKQKPMLEFAPELHQIHDARKTGSFTIGNKYPVLERKDERVSSTLWGNGISYLFMTVDDKGREVWVDDGYFIPAYTLSFEDDSKLEIELAEYGVIEVEGVDIRKYAEENGVGKLEVSDICSELGILSGVSKEEEDEKKLKPKWDTDSSPFWRPRKEENDLWRRGVVCDEGNDLLYDADKCLAAISRVFGGEDVSDPDEIIAEIQKSFPKRKVTWEEKNGFRMLTIDEARTKISYENTQSAYSGLCEIVSKKQALKAVGKLVANKIAKLF